MHSLIGLILFWTTFELFLKRQPPMQEEISRLQDLLIKKLKEYF